MKNDFDDIFQQVQKYFKEDNQTEDKNDISNLALLDSTTNRSYGNSFSQLSGKELLKMTAKVYLFQLPQRIFSLSIILKNLVM